ncbi:hypothetical protein [Actinomadura sp. NPDC000600]|uniref:hypothetical protein n=1 Tax=Actinomadura sp. NPDC000600 TaxID=3154262 RepID=UPI003394DEE6
MRLSLGIFDVFTYAIPGSLYLALGLYLAVRLDWLDAEELGHLPSVLLVSGIVMISYLVGHLTYFVGSLIDRAIPFWRRTPDESCRQFLQRVPAARGRPYIWAHGPILLAAIERYDKDAAQEISRLRATGLMLRNCCFPLLAGCGMAVVEAVVNRNLPVAAVCAVVLGVGGIATVPENQKLRHWAVLKTLETCFWLPEVDAELQPRQRWRFLRR